MARKFTRNLGHAEGDLRVPGSSFDRDSVAPLAIEIDKEEVFPKKRR